MRATSVQKAAGRLTSVVILLARRTAEWINAAVEAVARTRLRVGTVAEAAVDSLTAGREHRLCERKVVGRTHNAGRVSS